MCQLLIYYIKPDIVNFFKTFYLIRKKMFSMGICFYYFSEYNIILIVTSTFSIRLCIRQNLSVASFFICSAPFRSGEPALHGSTSFYALPKMSRNKKRQQRKLLSFGTECWNLCEPMVKEKADRLASLICFSMSSMCDFVGRSGMAFSWKLYVITSLFSYHIISRIKVFTRSFRVFISFGSSNTFVRRYFSTSSTVR